MLKKCYKIIENKTKVYLVDSKNLEILKRTNLQTNEIEYIIKQYRKHHVSGFEFYRKDSFDFVFIINTYVEASVKDLEQSRISGSDLLAKIRKVKISTVQILDHCQNPELSLAFMEGVLLANYQFLKHKKQEPNKRLRLFVQSKKITQHRLDTLNEHCDAVYFCKDLVNEPHNFQSAEQFSQTLVDKAKEVGVKATVFDKKQIESLKMGGLLGVNRGSKNPPVFVVLEWKPRSVASHISPIVLVGKGLVFDTGGMNLKSGEYMNNMKSDMAGGATVAATLFALAKIRFEHPVVALIPATDNRLGSQALVPGDVITMRSGNTVEVVNTDAEGRLILADALDYASLYKPRLVIEASTLTGAASRAIGKHGIVAMQKNAKGLLQNLQTAGEKTYERVVEFPLWDEYEEEIQSDVADFKNCGSGSGGAIVAGKFLAEFVQYPFIHLDMAGVAYNEKPFKYYGKQASGFGVRLLLKFFESIK